MLSLDVKAQPTVDESDAYTYCQSTASEIAVRQIKAELKLTIREELGSLEFRQQLFRDSSSLCECKSIYF